MNVGILQQIQQELARPGVRNRIQIPIVCSSGVAKSDVYLSHIRYYINKVSIPNGSAFNNPCNLVVGSNRVIENMRIFGGFAAIPNSVECNFIIDPGDEVFFEATPPAATFINAGVGRVTFILLGWRIN